MTNSPPSHPRMGPPSIPDPKSLLEGFDRAILSLETALTELRAGKLVNIDGLDTEIKWLCVKTCQLAGPEADPVLERMGKMTEMLERLSSELHCWVSKNEQRAQIEAKGKHRVASSAYRTPGQGES